MSDLEIFKTLIFLELLKSFIIDKNLAFFIFKIILSWLLMVMQILINISEYDVYC